MCRAVLDSVYLEFETLFMEKLGFSGIHKLHVLSYRVIAWAISRCVFYVPHVHLWLIRSVNCVDFQELEFLMPSLSSWSHFRWNIRSCVGACVCINICGKLSCFLCSWVILGFLISLLFFTCCWHIYILSLFVLPCWLEASVKTELTCRSEGTTGTGRCGGKPASTENHPSHL